MGLGCSSVQNDGIDHTGIRYKFTFNRLLANERSAITILQRLSPRDCSLQPASDTLP